MNECVVADTRPADRPSELGAWAAIVTSHIKLDSWPNLRWHAARVKTSTQRFQLTRSDKCINAT